MIIKIVNAGVNCFKNMYRPDPDEFLVGVDGGIYNIIELGLGVDLAVGDFDSCNIEEVITHCSEVITYPKEKDYSDLELALQGVLQKGARRIEIYNATGGRLDHFIAALNLVIRFAHYNVEMFDERNHIYVIDKTTVIKKSHYKYCSFFAAEESVHISLSGFKYNLKDHLLLPLDNLCLSNEICDEEGKITFEGKKVLVMETL